MHMTMARKRGTNATIICMAPDVCKTPIGNAVVPLPYMIVSRLDWAKMTVPKVKITNKEAFTMASRTDKVVGDEPGSIGGIKSNVNRGWCRPIANHCTVLIGGRELIQNDNLYEMNCAGPNGPGNTIGRLLYFEPPKL